MRYGQGPTRYRQLHRTQPVEKEQYRGVWQGQSVSFDRLFRGHRLTDAECEALWDIQKPVTGYGSGWRRWYFEVLRRCIAALAAKP